MVCWLALVAVIGGKTVAVALLNNVARTLKSGWTRGTRGGRGCVDGTAFAAAGLDEAAAYDNLEMFLGRTLQRFRGAVSLQMES